MQLKCDAAPTLVSALCKAVRTHVPANAAKHSATKHVHLSKMLKYVCCLHSAKVNDHELRYGAHGQPTTVPHTKLAPALGSVAKLC
jgi:hypothetical protein